MANQPGNSNNSNNNNHQGMAPSPSAQQQDEAARWKALIDGARLQTIDAEGLRSRLNNVSHTRQANVVVCSETDHRGETVNVRILDIIHGMINVADQAKSDALESELRALLAEESQKAERKDRASEKEKEEVNKAVDDLGASLQGMLSVSDEQADEAGTSASGSKKRTETVGGGVEQESLRLKTLEEECRRAVDHSTNLENSLYEAQLDVQEHQRQLGSSHNELGAARIQLEQYEQEVSNLHDKLSKAGNARELDAEMGESSAEDNSQLAQAVEKLMHSEQCRAELEQQALAEVSARDQAIERLQVEKTNDSALIERYEGHIRAMNAANAELNAEHNAEKNALIAHCEGVINSQNAALAEQRASIAGKDAAIGEKDAVIGEKEAAIDQLRTTVAERDATIEQQQASTGLVEADKAQGEAAIAEMGSTVASLQSEKLAMEQLAGQQRQQLEASNAEIEALRRQLGVASTESARLQGTNAELQQKLARSNEGRLREEARMTRAAAEETATTSPDLLKALFDAQEEAAEARGELNRALDSSRELRRANSRVERLEAARTTDASTIAGLRKDNAALLARAKAADDLRRRYTSGQEELKSAQAIIESLRQQIAGLRADPVRQAARRYREEVERLRAEIAADVEARSVREEVRRALEEERLEGPRDAGGELLRDANARLSEEASALREELAAVKKEAAADKKTIAHQTVCIEQSQEKFEGLHSVTEEQEEEEEEEKKMSEGERRPLALLESIRAAIAGIKRRPAWEPWAA